MLLGCSSMRSALKFLLSAIFTTGFCFLMTYLLTGYYPLDAILYGATRPSKMLSIFRIFADINIDFLSTPMVIISVLSGTVVAYIRKWKWQYAFCLVYILTITFYKVGHHQYYIPIFSWIIFILFKDRKVVSAKVKISFSILFLWINILAFIYPLTDNYRNDFFWIRDWVGLPTFLFQLFFITSLILFLERNRNINKNHW